MGFFGYYFNDLNKHITFRLLLNYIVIAQLICLDIFILIQKLVLT